MTAPRMCRKCGAELPGHVMWCLRCYEPVRHLTPRESAPPGVVFVSRGPQHRTSRWRAGPTTFGPVGRILITALLLALFPWSVFGNLDPLVLWQAFGYTLAATLVLRHTWRRERVVDERPGRLDPLRERVAARAPLLGRRLHVDPRATLVALVLLGLLGLSFGWAQSDTFGRYLLAATAGVLATGVFLAWFVEI